MNNLIKEMRENRLVSKLSMNREVYKSLDEVILRLHHFLVVEENILLFPNIFGEKWVPEYGDVFGGFIWDEFYTTNTVKMYKGESKVTEEKSFFFFTDFSGVKSKEDKFSYVFDLLSCYCVFRDLKLSDKDRIFKYFDDSKEDAVFPLFMTLATSSFILKDGSDYEILTYKNSENFDYSILSEEESKEIFDFVNQKYLSDFYRIFNPIGRQ